MGKQSEKKISANRTKIIITVVKLGGIYLEGQVTSVEVQEAGSVYVAQDEKGRYKKSQPVGYENAKVMIDILLEDTKTATTLEQLTEMQRLFKPYGQDKPKLLPIVNEDCAVRGITKVYFNFRSRIAMYEEICKLGGTNEGVLLAVRTLGYTSPVLVRANDLTGFSHFTLDGSWLLDGSRTLESDTIENRWAEFYIVIVMDADEEHPISFDIMRKTVRKWKEVGAKDNYFFKYNLSIRQPHTGNFLEVLYKKHLFYYDYRKLDGMWKLDGSYMLDAEMTPVGTRIGYRYESLYELHEAGLAVMAYNYACRMVESAILKAAYSFRMYYFEYLKTDGSWTTDGSYVVDAQMSPREMRWSTTFHHQHEEKLLMKQRYRMQPCEAAYSIRKTLEQYRMVIDYFDYLKLNGLWKLTGSRLMDAQRTEYTTKQAYSFGVEHTREFRVIWHEEHNLIFLDGTWSLDGSKIIDAWQKTEVL